MITHLLNLYSTLLSLRRKKKGEVFRLLLLLLPLLPPLSSAIFLTVFLNVCHFHYAAYFAFPFVYRLVRSNLYRSLPPPLAKEKKKKISSHASDLYNSLRRGVVSSKRVNHGTKWEDNNARAKSNDEKHIHPRDPVRFPRGGGEQTNERHGSQHQWETVLLISISPGWFNRRATSTFSRNCTELRN